MAKIKNQIIEKPFPEMFEEINKIFDTVGGSTFETEDEKVLNAILEHQSTMETKLKLVVTYARELERGIHYSRRN